MISLNTRSNRFMRLAFMLIGRGLPVAVCLFFLIPTAFSQQTLPPPNAMLSGQQQAAREQGLISEVIVSDLTLDLEQNHSKLVRTRRPVARVSVIDSTVVEVTQFGTTDLEIIGLKEGSTDLTLWFSEPGKNTPDEILRYRVRVSRPTDIDRRRKLEYGELEKMLNELFPNSSIELIVVADKLLVRGQARDSEEAANIMSVIRRQSGNSNGTGNSRNASISQGAATSSAASNDRGTATNVINMLRVPGEQQVLLKVRVAELSRTALRELGLDFSVTKDNFSITSSLGNAGNLVALLDGTDVSLMLRAVSSNGYSKVLAEPNLVTLSGRTASFIAGGQFAVPTAVGISGVQAATTAFQGFGTQLQFTPTVVDKDRIRLRVAPTLSSLNAANTVNGIPGLNTRSVFTTVDMREGQWLAIAGLMQDQQEGSKLRVPLIGDVPVAGALFSRNRIQRDETELLILVSPQLVHPLEADAAPTILPGMEVTEPTNHEFFLANRIEGNPACAYRSTVWPTEQAAVQRAIHHSKATPQYRQTQKYYLRTAHGFAD